MNALIPDRVNQGRRGKKLLDDVVRLFTELLLASGANLAVIGDAMSKAVAGAQENKSSTTFTELGALLRDCMEVMCAWRRDIALVDNDGEPTPLPEIQGDKSFEALCRKVGCKHPYADILTALLEFGAVSMLPDGKVVSETPTFLLGRSAFGGRLATDGLLKQLEGFLKAVHRNVCSVSGNGKPSLSEHALFPLQLNWNQSSIESCAVAARNSLIRSMNGLSAIQRMRALPGGTSSLVLEPISSISETADEAELGIRLGIVPT